MFAHITHFMCGHITINAHIKVPRIISEPNNNTGKFVAGINKTVTEINVTLKIALRMKGIATLLGNALAINALYKTTQKETSVNIENSLKANAKAISDINLLYHSAGQQLGPSSLSTADLQNAKKYVD